MVLHSGDEPRRELHHVKNFIEAISQKYLDGLACSVEVSIEVVLKSVGASLALSVKSICDK
jgi:hypothetical protein